jgi:hypothetical protein
MTRYDQSVQMSTFQFCNAVRSLVLAAKTIKDWDQIDLLWFVNPSKLWLSPSFRQTRQAWIALAELLESATLWELFRIGEQSGRHLPDFMNESNGLQRPPICLPKQTAFSTNHRKKYQDWKTSMQSVGGAILPFWLNSVLICMIWHCPYEEISMDNILADFLLEARLSTAGEFLD